MTQGIILAAGKATRLNGQFKPRVRVGGHPVLKWQLKRMPAETTLVGRSPESSLGLGCDYFTFDGGGGPVRALNAVLPLLPSEDVIVAFADTLWFSPIPLRGNWIGVSQADGGRVWDVVDEMGRSNRFEVPEGTRRTVAVGLYAFEDPEKLKWACEKALEQTVEPETHMFRVTNLFSMTPWRVDWLDVGDASSLAKADALLAGREP